MLNKTDIIKSSTYSTKCPRGTIYDNTFELPSGCRVLIINNFLDENKLNNYIDRSCTVERRRDITAFGAPKPRYEVSYTVDGEPNIYSNIKHYTTKYPEHVLELTERIQDVIEEQYTHTVQLSTGIDIHYSRYIPGSGSIAKHSDDEQNWCAVAIYSLGQTRYLRIRAKDGDKEFYNVKMQHNSLVVMLDSIDSEPGQFQRLYTHQVDKLSTSLKSAQLLGDRLSLNVRYLRADHK